MAVRVTIVNVRPDTTTDWYVKSADYVSYIQTNFVDNGKMIKESVATSADGLTKTYKSRYPNDSDRNDWMNPSLHPTIKAHHDASAAYGAANGISTTASSESI